MNIYEPDLDASADFPVDARDHGIGSFAPRSEVVDLTAERDRLSKENERLRKALEEFVVVASKAICLSSFQYSVSFERQISQARAALSPAEER